VRLPRRRQAQPLRYYLYISDSKLDMLYEQIDESALRRISAEIKVDLKLASLTLRQVDNPAPARTAKLRIVERFIEQHHHVGTIEEPGSEYFRGQMDMSWGWLISDDQPGVVFLGRGTSVVALAGSRRHVLGTDPRAGGSISPAPAIIVAFGAHIIPEGPYTEHDHLGFDLYERALSLAKEDLSRGAPTQRLEFLAVPIGEAEMRGWPDPEFKGLHGVLGTPLYVATVRHDPPNR
jgi:hypothetical protein